MKKHIGYKVEADISLDVMRVQFRGFITYFDGKSIILTSSDWFDDKTKAWKWISDTLAKWEEEEVADDTE